MNTKDKELSICIFCDEPVYKDQRKFNLGLERPVRLDLLVHRVCYQKFSSDGTLKSFLQLNLTDYIEKYMEKKNGKTKKARSKFAQENK